MTPLPSLFWWCFIPMVVIAFAVLIPMLVKETRKARAEAERDLWPGHEGGLTTRQKEILKEKTSGDI